MRYFYRVIHSLFGLDYIYWEQETINNSYSGVSRIFISKDGRPCFWLSFAGQKKLKGLEAREAVIWLTCPPEKYFKTEDKNAD